MTRYQHIQGWRYPDGVRLAVNFTIDFDAQLFRQVLEEPPLELAQGEFGGRTGIWRRLELFDRHRIGLTIFTPGRIPEPYPASLREAMRCGFQIANHMWEPRVPTERELEWDHLRRTNAALETISGRPPVGTRSRHRLALLAREGARD